MSQSAAFAPPNRAARRALKRRGASNGLLLAPTPELLISQQTGDEIEYDAARECAEARLIREYLQLEVDPRFDVIYAKPGATALRGGYWHIIFRNDSGVPNIWEVCALDNSGRPCAPTMEHVNRIRERDLNHTDVWARYKAEQERAKRSRDTTAEEKHREFREKLLERLDHLYRVQVALPGHIKDRLQAEAAAALARECEEGEREAALPETPTADTAGAAASPSTTVGEDEPPHPGCASLSDPSTPVNPPDGQA